MKPTLDDARAALARSQAAREKMLRKLKKAGVRVPADLEAESTLAVVRASLHQARFEDAVERRIAATGSDRWLTQDEVAKMTGLGRTTLWKLRREDPTFPTPKSPTGGRAIRFRESEVRRWMAERERKAEA